MQRVRLLSTSASRWPDLMTKAGVPNDVVKAWASLRASIAIHQRLLREEGIGLEVSERDRVVVNAQRVGLRAPFFADELDFSEADLRNGAAQREPGKPVMRSEVDAAAEAAKKKANERANDDKGS